MTGPRDRYRRIKELALRARDLPGEERAAFLAAEAGDDVDLVREVGELLDFDRDASPVLRTSGAARRVTTGFVAGVLGGAGAHPESIGPYRILGVLGEGGMGVVYRAEQTEPIRRTVALKQVRLGMDTARVVARFEAERRTLALMEHPHIARVLDAGAGESGRPYFVLELVDGKPITDFCREESLEVPQRLRLFLDVLSAVQHAHQKGIIHRDLKPSNLLVSRIDGTPVPKVIDFGIAKAVLESDAATPAVTVEGQIIGTPEYMSPEQADPGSERVDTRSDVYALGVVLFEMLAGELPRSRNPLPPLVAGRPPGDLDAIVGRAVEEDPVARYASVGEFADDIRRFLADEPVLAARPDNVYRMRKFVRRHRRSVSVAALVGAALLAGAAGTAWQAVRATRERAIAERRLTTVRDLANRFVFGVDERVAPLPGAAPVREYIAATGAELLGEMTADPEATRELGETLVGAWSRLGLMQVTLGQTGEALTSFDRAVALAERGLAGRPDDPGMLRALADALDRSGQAHTTGGEVEEGAESYERAAEIFGRLAAAEPESVSYRRRRAGALSTAGFSWLRMGRAEHAVELHREAIRLLEEADAERPGDAGDRIQLATAVAYLAESVTDLGNLEEALALYRRSADTLEAAWRADPTDMRALNRLAVILGAVGLLLVDLDRPAEAHPVLERSVELRAEYARLNPENMRARRDLGKGYLQLGDAESVLGERADAASHYAEGVRICAETHALDPDDTSAARYLVNLRESQAALAIGEGHFTRALALLDTAKVLNDTLMAREPERDDIATAQAHIHKLAGDAHRGRAGDASPRAATAAWSAARDRYRESLDVLETMKARDMLIPGNESLIDERRRDVVACDSALATVGAP